MRHCWGLGRNCRPAPGHLRLWASSHIRRLNSVYNRLGLNNRQAFNRSRQGCFLVKNKSPPIYPSPYQYLDTVRLWNGEDNPMIVNCCAEPSLDNISPSWIAPLCACTYQARHQFPPCVQCPEHHPMWWWPWPPVSTIMGWWGRV